MASFVPQSFSPLLSYLSQPFFSFLSHLSHPFPLLLSYLYHTLYPHSPTFLIPSPSCCLTFIMPSTPTLPPFSSLFLSLFIILPHLLLAFSLCISLSPQTSFYLISLLLSYSLRVPSCLSAKKWSSLVLNEVDLGPNPAHQLPLLFRTFSGISSSRMTSQGRPLEAKFASLSPGGLKTHIIVILKG